MPRPADRVLIGPVPAPGLHVMTFNIRRRLGIDPRRADTWATRSPALRVILSSEQPALLGVQEALPRQAHVVGRALGPRYRRLGHGRNADGNGEGCPLYYDSERLELRGWRQLALSATPEVPGSRSWGNMTPRILVLAEFRDRETDRHLTAVNTHFDNFSRRSRLDAAEAVRELVEQAGLPTVVTGDLNSGEDTAPLRELFSGGTLVDAWEAARTRLSPDWGTFPNYREPRRDRKRIDWIAVTPSVEVDRIGISTRRPDGVWASDHLPVQAVVHLAGTA